MMLSPKIALFLMVSILTTISPVELKCQRCGSGRVAQVSGFCRDCCYFHIEGTDIEHDGYTPDGVGLGDADKYIDMRYCMDCGQMQGHWPLPQSEFEKEEEEKKRSENKANKKSTTQNTTLKG